MVETYSARFLCHHIPTFYYGENALQRRLDTSEHSNIQGRFWSIDL